MDRPIALEARSVDLDDRPAFLLGRARIDPRAHEYAIAGKSKRIQPQTLKVLVALHDRSGRVVTREELIDRCWGGRIVGDDVINRCISLLRPVAAESGGFRIETIPRSGYRLVEISSGEARSRRVWALAAATTGLVGLAAAGAYLAQRRPSHASTLTIALLPFATNSPDRETREIAATAREAVANSLTQGAYSVSEVDSAPHAADFLISAQLSDEAGKIIANVRMEETAHHVVVFSHKFETERTKADDFPELIGAQVASQVSWTAPLISIEQRHPSDPAIIASILQSGSTGLTDFSALHDYEISRTLAVKDPNSPLAQVNFAFNTAFALDEIPREDREAAVAAARTAADRAVSLAPEFGDSYAPWCLLHSEQMRIGCERRLRAGIRVDPDAPFASWFLANLILHPAGRDHEALELARASLAHDPFMPEKIALMLQVLEATGQAREAEALYQRSNHWWPNNPSLYWSRAAGILDAGDFERLARFADEAGNRRRPDQVIHAVGRKSLPAIRAACSDAKDFDAIACMLGLARFGDLDSAFALADRLYPYRRGRTVSEQERIWLDNPDTNSTEFLASQAAAPLRRDPRFFELAKRAGLIEYWRSVRLPDWCRTKPELICWNIRKTK